jgi:hypothetical protein
MVFGHQNFVIPVGHREEKLFVNFEHYDLANGEE